MRRFFATSTLLKNFKANANSTKPNVTFNAFCQPPLLVSTVNNLGKKAKIINGNASPKPKPNIPLMGPKLPALPPARPKIEATKFPVQLKETTTNVNAIKNMPT